MDISYYDKSKRKQYIDSSFETIVRAFKICDNINDALVYCQKYIHCDMFSLIGCLDAYVQTGDFSKIGNKYYLNLN